MHQTLNPWFLANRRDLPWRKNKTPYRVWLSEILLQQTQVSVGTAYFERFVTQYPDIFALANAPEDEVMAIWAGLGYYSRCRNLHKTAKIIAHEFDGQFPDDFDGLLKLPGIGSYTAGAILSFAFGKPAAVVDGNVARVLARYLADSTPINSPQGKKHFEAISLQLAKNTKDCGILQEAIMELGAAVCKPRAPNCGRCPLASTCQAHLTNASEQFPQKTPKKPRTILKMACAIMIAGDQICLFKKQSRGLFGGLYQPANTVMADNESPKDAIRRVLDELGISRAMSEEPILCERTLTHRDLRLYGFVIRLPKHGFKKGNWVDISRLGTASMPSAMKATVEKALEIYRQKS